MIALRPVVLTLAFLALAACDSGTVPSPAEQSEPRAAAPSVAANEVVLRADGLDAGAEAFYFAAGQSEVEAALSRAIGKPDDSGENAECGSGPLGFASFPGGLTVHFQEGSLVGWNWREPSDSIRTAGGFAIGAERTAIEALDGYTPISDSTLGEEFALGDRLGGFFEESRLSMLYAGTQCFFR